MSGQQSIVFVVIKVKLTQVENESGGEVVGYLTMLADQ